MLSFLKKWFKGGSRMQKDTASATDQVLDLGPVAKEKQDTETVPKADVHRLMIQATQIRKNKGYHQAVQFLQALAESYLKTANTAMVACINKLIPYMKRDHEISYAKTHAYLEELIKHLPEHEPYFLNIHITMAELLQSESTEKAIDYLEQFLRRYPPSPNTYYHVIRLADFYGEKGETSRALEYLTQAKALWETRLQRFQLIKMQRRWHRSSAELARTGGEKRDLSGYLFHRFTEFALDMARTLDPAQIDEFHKRKDQYYKENRGFAGTTPFEQAIEAMGLAEQREVLIKDIYGFVFEEMPLLLGVTEKQLHFKTGQPESLEEVRQKKLFADRPFTQLEEIENHIQKLINRRTES